VIVLDGSTLFAVLLGERQGSACRDVMEREDELLLSAGSLTELLIVAAGKRVLDVVEPFVAELKPTISPLTERRARAAADAYRRWSKGFHPAGLTTGDTFAYALAKEHDCPLLYIGDDFAKTDVASALG
jgi:ribonuclease VapC